MGLLTQHQLSSHFQSWLNQPEQSALRALSGDAAELRHADPPPSSAPAEFLDAFVVLWDSAQPMDLAHKCNNCGSEEVIVAADVDPNTLHIEFRDDHAWCDACHARGWYEVSLDYGPPDPPLDCRRVTTVLHLLRATSALQHSARDRAAGAHQRLLSSFAAVLGPPCDRNGGREAPMWPLSSRADEDTAGTLHLKLLPHGAFTVVRAMIFVPIAA